MKPQPGDALFVAGDHFQFPAAFVVQHRARAGHCFGQHEGEAAQRADVFLDDRQPRIDQRGNIVEFGAGIGFPHPAVERGEQRLGRVVMLVLDFAGDLLDQIFEGDDPVGARIFVDHHRQMDPARTHVVKHVERVARLRHEQRLAQQRGPVLGHLAAREEREDVLDQHHADDLVERFAVNRQPRMAVFGKGLDHLVPARAGWNRDDLAARDRDIVGVVLAEMQEVAQHLPLERREVAVGIHIGTAIFLVLVDCLLKLRAQREVGLTHAHGAAQHPAQPGSTIAVSGCRLGHLAPQIPKFSRDRHMGRQCPLLQAR